MTDELTKEEIEEIQKLVKERMAKMNFKLEEDEFGNLIISMEER